MIETFDKDINWKPQDLVPEDFKHDEQEERKNSPRRVISFLIATVISIFVGVYSGLRSRELFESFVYTLMFLGEAGVCKIISKMLPTSSLQNSTHRFSLLFTLTAAFSISIGLSKSLINFNNF